MSRLMALAIQFEGLVRRGEVKSYAELAWLGRVTRARLTQIMALLNLAPEIQEELLCLPPTAAGRDPVLERDLRPVAAAVGWEDQRRLWRDGRSSHAGRAERGESKPGLLAAPARQSPR